DRLPAIDEDIARMETRGEALGEQRLDAAAVEKLIRAVQSPAGRPLVPVVHVPSVRFRAGQPVVIDVTNGVERPAGVRLHFRRVNQSERWQSQEMRESDGRWRAVVPGTYTDSPFPLQYYFEPRDASGRAWLVPGLGRNLCGQSYYV